MKTTIKVVDILYQTLKASSLVSEITGKIRKEERPVNSSLEDITINCLPINNEQLQRCVANVNVFVPDIRFEEGGAVVYKPDFTRLDELADIAWQVLKEGRGVQDYHYQLQQQQLLKDETSNQHYINIRIDFYAYNIH